MSARTELVVRTALVVTTVLAVIGLAWLLVQITEILVIVLISAILATGIAPIGAAIEHRRWTRRGIRLSRIVSLVFAYLAFLLALVVIVGLLVTPVVIESRAFLENLTANLANIETSLLNLQSRYGWLPDVAAIIRRLPQEFSRLGGYFAPAAGVAFRLLGGVATVITVLVLTFYMLLEGPVIRRGFLALFPKEHREQVAGVFKDIAVKFGGWLRGQLILGVIIGVAAAVGMAAIGMPYPVLLGIVAGVTELIPMIGPVLGAIPAVFLALFQPWWKIVFTIAWYALIQQAEGNILVPRVMRHTVGMSPLLTIIALVTGAKLLGLVGALLAVPVAAALQVVVGEILETFRPSD